MYLTKRYQVFKVAPDKNLACNAITGKVMVLSNQGLEMLEALSAGDTTVSESTFLEALQKNDYLFDSPEMEETAFEQVCQRSWKEFQEKVPRQFTFILNSHCNFNCPYCFEQETLRERAQTLSPAQIKAAFHVIDALTTELVPEVEVFGGEPLLPKARPNLEYLLGQAQERGITTSLQTNGYYLSNSLDIFRRHKKTIRRLQVTLDGPPEIHNQRRIPRSGEPTFNRIVDGLDQLLAEDPSIHINLRTNVDRTNIDALEAMAEFYKAKGWTDRPNITFIAAPVDNRSCSLKNPEVLLGWHELFERLLPLSTDTGGGPFDLLVFKSASHFRYYFSCLSQSGQHQPVFTPKILFCEAAALKLFVFHPDGRIYPCPEANGMETLAIGKYYPEWEMDEAQAELWRAQTILTRPKCRNCEISTFCGGGCVLKALLTNGSMATPDCENAPEVLTTYFNWIGQALN